MAVYKGYRKGFIVAVFAVIALIIGLAAALKLSATVAIYLQNNVTISIKWLPFVSFVLVLFLVILLVNIVGKLIQKTFEMAMLGWVNRIAGIILYSLLYTIIFSVFLFYADKIHLFDDATVMASKTYVFICPWGPKVMEKFGNLIPTFKDMFTQLGDYFEGVSTKIPH